MTWAQEFQTSLGNTGRPWHRKKNKRIMKTHVSLILCSLQTLRKSGDGNKGRLLQQISLFRHNTDFPAMKPQPLPLHPAWIFKSQKEIPLWEGTTGPSCSRGWKAPQKVSGGRRRTTCRQTQPKGHSAVSFAWMKWQLNSNFYIWKLKGSCPEAGSTLIFHTHLSRPRGLGLSI
jgi:hypothetical protein